jgi:hypothetical protein
MSPGFMVLGWVLISLIIYLFFFKQNLNKFTIGSVWKTNYGQIAILEKIL